MKVIGTTTTYHGTEHPPLVGYKLIIVAVLKGEKYIKDDDTLEREGGITTKDRIEVSPWIESAGRYSFVTYDPRSVDLDGIKIKRRRRK